MPQKHLYEYAVIRIVPRVDREEFINAGIIMFCKKENFLKTKIYFDKQRIKILFPGIEDDHINHIQNQLIAFENICNGTAKNTAIARLDAPSRFRWLTAVKSTIIQTSKVHPGLTENCQNTLDCIFKQMTGE